MYRKEDAQQLKFENFHLPFCGRRCSDNRWIILTGQISWQAIEHTCGQQFCTTILQPLVLAA
jgi:hypothetical protein